jgi:hypothetical protein
LLITSDSTIHPIKGKGGKHRSPPFFKRPAIKLSFLWQYEVAARLKPNPGNPVGTVEELT